MKLAARFKFVYSNTCTINLFEMSPVWNIPLDESLFFVSLVTVGMMCHTLFLAQFIGKKNLCYRYTDYLD